MPAPPTKRTTVIPSPVHQIATKARPSVSALRLFVRIVVTADTRPQCAMLCLPHNVVLERPQDATGMQAACHLPVAGVGVCVRRQI